MRNFDFEGGDRPPPSPPLHSEKLVGDRKIFFFDLKENDRGRFIKITEDVRGRRDTIMLPLEVAEDFLDAIQRCLDADREMQ
ncbi:MAG: DNA-binding protein [Verrucomicrobiaceae bacterium]|nr:DNA-binding protein [Verrucomicrobiaceae bacterium]